MIRNYTSIGTSKPIYYLYFPTGWISVAFSFFSPHVSCQILFLKLSDTLNALWFDEITCLFQQNTEKTNFLKFLVPQQLQGHYKGQVRTVISQHHNHHKVTKDLIQLLLGLKDLSKAKKNVKKIFTT